MVAGSKGNDELRCRAASRGPRCRPQSRRNRYGPASRRCMEPETDWAAPRKVTVGGPERGFALGFIALLYSLRTPDLNRGWRGGYKMVGGGAVYLVRAGSVSDGCSVPI